MLGAYRTFQVAITHIESATGLQFPALAGADPFARDSGAEAAAGGPVYLPLESPVDLVL